ncbi:MAG TPA: hypothetical protein VJG83_01395 [archaeon]|nr:hypothetical protein [archaeon]
MKRFGQKGFTLFTALVAFILIVLAMLLVQSMISTERTTSDIISDISEQQEMQAIADLARADALQVFNFGIRYTIEDFSTRDSEPQDGLPENVYVVFASDAQDWETLQQRFVKERFGVGENSSGNAFALLAARHLISLLDRSDDARGYDIELVNPDEATMSTILKDTFNGQVDEDGSLDEFFQVIRCEDNSEFGSVSGHFDNCTGSFYVTMDLSKDAMSDEQYEKFPQVRVQNKQTSRVLKEPILPRGKFRIYVPVRLFKALAGAREIADPLGGGLLSDSFLAELPKEGQNIRSSAARDITKALEDRIVLKGMGQGSGLTFKGTERDGFLLKSYKVDVTATRDVEENEKLLDYKITLYFEEKNDKYRVSTKGSNIYGITLVKFNN